MDEQMNEHDGWIAGQTNGHDTWIDGQSDR
jgi:hypothetical protein